MQLECNKFCTLSSFCICFLAVAPKPCPVPVNAPFTAPFSAAASCRFCQLKNATRAALSAADFCIDEPHKKRYTMFWRCSCAAGCRGVAQLVARLLWEQEAASSSLATPILQTHVDSMRTTVRFCFAGKPARKCAETAHTARPLSKNRAAFFLFPLFCGIDKSPQVRYTE